jgi:hypothetical protein
MLVSNAPPAAWNLNTGQGSAAQYAFTLTTLSGAPYPVDDTTWEYVVRPVSGLGDPLMTITTTPTADGSLTVTSTDVLTQVTLALTPVATSGMAAGPYSHALWMDPGTDSAYCWLTGALQVNLIPQP